MYNDLVYALHIPCGYKEYDIVHLEMINVIVALKLWGHVWANHKVHICCDNLAVVDVLNSGRARDSVLATSARNVWMLTAFHNIYLVVTHIQGVQNVIADLLSRWQGTAASFHKLHQYIPCPMWTPVHIDHMLLNYDI